MIVCTTTTWRELNRMRIRSKMTTQPFRCTLCRERDRINMTRSPPTLRLRNFLAPAIGTSGIVMFPSILIYVPFPKRNTTTDRVHMIIPQACDRVTSDAGSTVLHYSRHLLSPIPTLSIVIIQPNNNTLGWGKDKTHSERHTRHGFGEIEDMKETCMWMCVRNSSVGIKCEGGMCIVIQWGRCEDRLRRYIG